MKIKSEIMIIAILIKLLVISIVASRDLGLSFRLSSLSFSFSLRSSSRSLLFNEKNATSEPEISAEQISRPSKVKNNPSSPQSNVVSIKNEKKNDPSSGGGSVPKVI